MQLREELALTRGPGAPLPSMLTFWEAPDPNAARGPEQGLGAGASLSTPPIHGPRAPPRSAPGRREAWPARADPAAAMGSVVEYKGLKAGYHCGYCDCEEGKASCGECPGRRGRRRRPRPPPARPPARHGRASHSREAPKPCSPAPASLSHSFLPRPFPFTLRLGASPSPNMVVPLGEGAEIAEGCPRSRWRGRRRRRGLAARPGWRAPSGFARASGRPGGAGHCGVAAAAAAVVVSGWAASLLGPGPWLSGPLSHLASWSISRARTSTAAATARTSRAVAPMVSGPGRAGGRGGRRGLGGSAQGRLPWGSRRPARADRLEGPRRLEPLPGPCLAERVRNGAPPQGP